MRSKIAGMSSPDRRAFLAVFATSSFGTTLLPGVLWAQMQPGTKVVTAEMVREAAKLAGLEITDADAADLSSSLSSLARGAEGIARKTLTNASPLPIHFDPRPHGVKIPAAPTAPLFRIEPPACVRARHGRRLLAGDSAPGGDHAGRRAASHPMLTP